jgi:transcriptional regulator with XRE-family HTH domain
LNDLQFGAVIRAVRKRRGISQLELAGLARVSQGTVSLIERGHLESVSLKVLRRVADAAEVRLDLLARWRGGELDRLLSRRHSTLGESFAAFLVSHPGWIVGPEASFSIYGERGVVDQLAWHEATAHVLVVELKTAFFDINEMLGTLDRKRRLARTIAADRGWAASLVSAWVIVEDTHTNRRHATEHRTLLRTALPFDGRQLRSFLARPTEPTRGMAFWPSTNHGSHRPSGRAGTAPVGRPRPQNHARQGPDSRSARRVEPQNGVAGPLRTL